MFLSKLLVFLSLQLIIINLVKGLIVYNSTIPRGVINKLSGLKISNNQFSNVDWSSGISICARFNYKTLYQPLFRFDQQSHVGIWLGYPISWAVFDNFEDQWLSYNHSAGYQLSIGKWNHLCFSVNPSNTIIIILVNTQSKISSEKIYKTILCLEWCESYRRAKFKARSKQIAIRSNRQYIFWKT